MSNKYLVLFCFAILLFITFISSPVVFASTTDSFVMTGGEDVSDGANTIFSASDIEKLATSDDVRIQSNATTWPTDGVYDENKYIEFIFSPNIPVDAVIENVTFSNEFRRSGALSEAKLEVWEGTIFNDQILTTGSINTDHTDTVDVTSYINTPEKVNNLKARFLAYRENGGSTKTSHDFIGLSVTYNIPPPPPANNVPVALDKTITISIGTPTDITLEASDLDNDALTFIIVSEPILGTLGTISGNTVTYTPSTSPGSDSFTFKVNDAKSDSNVATVNISLEDTTSPTIDAITTNNITSSSATISWATGEGANSQIEYGVDTNYGATTTLDPNLNTTHSQVLENLIPNTIYHFRIKSVDQYSNQSISPDQSFTTLQLRKSVTGSLLIKQKNNLPIDNQNITEEKILKEQEDGKIVNEVAGKNKIIERKINLPKEQREDNNIITEDVRSSLTASALEATSDFSLDKVLKPVKENIITGYTFVKVKIIDKVTEGVFSIFDYLF